MISKKITLLPGDGIGPEVTNQAIKVIEAINYIFGHKFQLEKALIGAASIEKDRTPITDQTLEKCKNSDAILLGAIGSPLFDNNPNLKVRPEQGLLKLRKELGLFANIRPIKTNSTSKTFSPIKEEQIKDVDLVIFRELTGGLYFGEKHISEDGKAASDRCTYHKDEIVRIGKMAFEMAMKRNRKICLVDKANVLETSRLWRKVIQKLSHDFPEVKVDYLYVDNAAMQLVLNPRQFDILLTENLFGDILSDLASVIPGSIGLLPSSSLGNNLGLFEPIHGSYPEAAGKDIANPFATILSVAMMYEYFNLDKEASTIRKAVDWAIEEGIVTQDLNKEQFLPCSKVGDLLAEYIESEGSLQLNKHNFGYDEILV